MADHRDNDASTRVKEQPRCPGKSGHKCSSFVRAGSPHDKCRKCRSCTETSPCNLCEHKGPDHWRALSARGRRNKSKSATPAPQTRDHSPTSNSTDKTRGDGTLTVAKYPKGKGSAPLTGEGLSSVATVSKPNPSLCSVKGFPPATRVLRDGSLSYSVSDDNGGTWDFLGSGVEVLVEWHIFIPEKDSYYKGNASYTPQTFKDIIRDLESRSYTFSLASKDEGWNFETKEREYSLSPTRGRSPTKRLAPQGWVKPSTEGDERDPTSKSGSCSAARERTHSHHSRDSSRRRQHKSAASKAREPALDVSANRHRHNHHDTPDPLASREEERDSDHTHSSRHHRSADDELPSVQRYSRDQGRGNRSREGSRDGRSRESGTRHTAGDHVSKHSEQYGRGPSPTFSKKSRDEKSRETTTRHTSPEHVSKYREHYGRGPSPTFSRDILTRDHSTHRSPRLHRHLTPVLRDRRVQEARGGRWAFYRCRVTYSAAHPYIGGR
jgi:hypothetical protein